MMKILNGLAPEQLAFALAKTALGIAEGLYKQETASIDYENETVEEICRKEAEAEKKVGYDRAKKLYFKAMDKLFAWAEKRFLSLPECKGKESDIKEVFQKVKSFPMCEEKLAEICMSLKA